MNAYIMLWLVLCLLSVKGAAAKESRTGQKLAFWFCFLLLAAMLIFRYGQGSDYFGYRYNYYKVSDVAITFPEYEVHGELGYQLVCNVFRVFHIPFEWLVAFLATVQMGCMLAFYKRYHIDCAFALLLTFPTLYLTYFVSGMRQGLVIAIFLGLLFPMLEKKHYVGYVLGTLLCMTFHTVAAVFLLLPFAQKIRRVEILQVAIAVAWLAGLVLATPEGQQLVESLGVSGLNYYLGQTSLSAAAIAERLLFLGIITWLYIKLSAIGKCSGTFRLAYICYLVAMALYGALMWNGLVSSRTAGALRFVEIYLLVYGVKQMERASRYLVVVALVVFQTFMVTKNINAAIREGPYREGVHVLNYPYVSVFAAEDIYEYREILNKYINIS